MHQRTANRARLKAFIEAEAGPLLGTLRLYVWRAGLAEGEAVQAAATELLSEVVVEALHHADRFRPTGEPKAWLLGIAANLIKRHQAEHARQDRREPLLTDLRPAWESDQNESDFFDRLAGLAVEGPEAAVEAGDQVEAWLAHVSAADGQVLRLAILHEMDGNGLARALGISPGAARVRLHRALNRLRAALAEGTVPSPAALDSHTRRGR